MDPPTEADPSGDEPGLPELPRLPREAPGPGRKRTYPFTAPGTEVALSSDIGFFSSDDDPSVDNYVQGGRQKRHHRGTWYDHNHAASDPPQDDDDSQEDVDVVPETPKAKPRLVGRGEGKATGLSRALSGAGHPPPTPPLSNPASGHPFTPRRGIPSSQGFPSSQTYSPGQRFAASQPLPSSQAQETARKRTAVVQAIEKRIDRGESVIDLTNIGLDDDSLSVDTFKPLIDLQLVPRVKPRAGHYAGHARDPLTTSKDGYLHRESPIVLILANNRLTRLPGTLFDIDNLVELSLRHNQLTEVPPAIAKCRSLRSLNLSSNKLRWLPYELAEVLPRLHQLSLAGNDFYEPDPSCVEGWTYEGPLIEASELPGDFIYQSAEGLRETRLIAWYVGRGPVQYSDSTGRVYSTFKLPQTGGRPNRIPLQAGSERTAPLAHGQGESQARLGSNQGFGTGRVPSLIEVCARALAGDDQLPEDYYSSEDAAADEPDVVDTVLAAADQSRYAGGERCAVCGKFFVIPRTQWVDFLYCRDTAFVPEVLGRRLESRLAGDEVIMNIVPSLRKGCSWKCVPYGKELKSGERLPIKI